MDTWRIATTLHADRLWLGIPDYLGGLEADAKVEALPSLEERCGEEWLENLLELFMPTDRAWAWWTRNTVFRQSRLVAANAPARMALDPGSKVARRKSWLRQMSLCVVPPGHAQAQRSVLQWAGADTEQIPDQLWVAAAGAREWDLELVSAFCRDRARWSNAATAAAQPAERIILLFDRHVYCALEPAAGAAVQSELDGLARRWGIRLLPGRPADAWVTRPG